MSQIDSTLDVLLLKIWRRKTQSALRNNLSVSTVQERIQVFPRLLNKHHRTINDVTKRTELLRHLAEVPDQAYLFELPNRKLALINKFASMSKAPSRLFGHRQKIHQLPLVWHGHEIELRLHCLEQLHRISCFWHRSNMAGQTFELDRKAGSHEENLRRHNFGSCKVALHRCCFFSSSLPHRYADRRANSNNRKNRLNPARPFVLLHAGRPVVYPKKAVVRWDGGHVGSPLSARMVSRARRSTASSMSSRVRSTATQPVVASGRTA
ncbi:hypothetical protein SAMN05216567_1017 [Variovorax sp. OK605]|nr:hypothetical protein SAMN05216567_1017 [Variovorax sp. OK605]